MNKKTPGADLEGKRGLFFQIGLAIALLIALLVINYQQPKKKIEPVTVTVTGLEIRSAAYMDSVSAVKPPEVSR